MNNNYDREEDKQTPKSYNEMIAAGNAMTADGFWVPSEGNEDLIEVPVNPVPKVSLVVFLNGEQVLAEVIEKTDNTRLVLRNPLGVILEGVTDADEDGQYQSTVSYGAWLPLAADRDIVVERSSIMAICEPIPSLEESYLEGVNG